MSIRVPLDIFLEIKKKKKKRDKGEKIRENEGTVAESNENAQKKKRIQFLAKSDIHKGATGRQSKLVY